MELEDGLEVVDLNDTGPNLLRMPNGKYKTDQVKCQDFKYVSS